MFRTGQRVKIDSGVAGHPMIGTLKYWDSSYGWLVHIDPNAHNFGWRASPTTATITYPFLPPQLLVVGDLYWWAKEHQMELLGEEKITARIIKPIAKVIVCCLECKEANPWAEPNRPDGTHVCYSCRTGFNGWKYR